MSQIAFRRSQVYCFLANAFLYPRENWLEDLPDLDPILRELDIEIPRLSAQWAEPCGESPLANPPDEAFNLHLERLQKEHRHAFGLTGSLCYETEFGLPHEFRQSQELADIAGFYRSFGFNVGGTLRERPDHIAVELEFMYLLALKEAYAASIGMQEQVEICRDAQRKFLQDHLGRWAGLFSEALALSAGGVYPALARFAADFVAKDADLIGAHLEARQLAGVTPTPYGPELSCEGCLAAEISR